MSEILLDAFFDVLRLIPFLFLSFIVMELIEHRLNNKIKLTKVNKYGPLAGATLGIIPQCGFSTIASNLYAARVISLGTLIAMYLSTSDEMIPIMISYQVNSSIIIKILVIKFLLGFLFGFIIDLVYRKKRNTEIKEFCEDEHCHCEDGILKSSIVHTMKIVIFIFFINIVLNMIIDREMIVNFITNNKILAPVITSIFGLIPNCVSSIIITELYIEKIITFGSCISGLLSGSGVGILVLFKQNKCLKENFIILVLLILIASICGIIFNMV